MCLLTESPLSSEQKTTRSKETESTCRTSEAHGFYNLYKSVKKEKRKNLCMNSSWATTIFTLRSFFYFFKCIHSFSSVLLSPSSRVTSQPTQSGERASCRGRDKNTLASSSNTTTPATRRTIRTHTDRYTCAQSSGSPFVCFNQLFWHFTLTPGTLNDWTKEFSITRTASRHRCIPLRAGGTRVCVCLCVDRIRPRRQDDWNQCHASSSSSLMCS